MDLIIQVTTEAQGFIILLSFRNIMFGEIIW